MIERQKAFKPFKIKTIPCKYEILKTTVTTNHLFHIRNLLQTQWSFFCINFSIHLKSKEKNSVNKDYNTKTNLQFLSASFLTYSK